MAVSKMHKSLVEKNISFTVKDGLGLNNPVIKTYGGDEIAITGMSYADKGQNKKALRKSDEMEDHYTDDFILSGVGGKQYRVTREVILYKPDAKVKGGRFKSKIIGVDLLTEGSSKKVKKLFYLDSAATLIGLLDGTMSNGQYLLKTFGIDDVPCVSFDYISWEDYQEIIDNMDGVEVSWQAFDKCGAEEVFRHDTTKNVLHILTYKDIISAVVSNSEVAEFMERIATVNNRLFDGLYDYMDDCLADKYDDYAKVNALSDEIELKKSIKAQCQFFEKVINEIEESRFISKKGSRRRAYKKLVETKVTDYKGYSIYRLEKKFHDDFEVWKAGKKVVVCETEQAAKEWIDSQCDESKINRIVNGIIEGKSVRKSLMR